jgi:hypothetical protein
MFSFTFDGTIYTITPVKNGHDVHVIEGKHESLLTSENDKDKFDAFTRHARALKPGMVSAGMDPWVADRIAYCFMLADRKIAQGLA